MHVIEKNDVSGSGLVEALLGKGEFGGVVEALSESLEGSSNASKYKVDVLSLLNFSVFILIGIRGLLVRI